jgi:antiviral helicase SKI2
VTSSEHAVIVIHDADILHITTKTIKIDPDKILNDVKKREIPRFKHDPPAASVATAVQQLIKVTRTIRHL